jgi:hypothetical protein
LRGAVSQYFEKKQPLTTSNKNHVKE